MVKEDKLWQLVEQAKENPLLATYENLPDEKQLEALILLDDAHPNSYIVRELYQNLGEQYPTPMQLEEWKQEKTHQHQEYWRQVWH